jgi:putative membrane protein
VASGTIALRSAALVVAVGAGQGLLVAGAAQLGLGLTPGTWSMFALACAGTGAAFGLVNQGLAAAFGGVGRLIALGVAVVALVAGFASTAPPALLSLAGALPTAPALQLVTGAASGDASGAWTGAALLLLFALGGFALTFAGVAARRSVRLSAAGRADAGEAVATSA